ncbi:MAG: L,D-transpeptidase family protein [Candidatus Dormibacteraeota bacterium]|nr:L,D-transpeptidase family protein [Candidatus Dormibacteraeota bacterium]
MIAVSGLRPAIVLVQVVLTFGAAQLGGVVAATRYQQEQERGAQATIDRADRGFDAGARQALDDGTPKTAVDPVVTRHKALRARAIPPSTFVIDRMRIEALRKRAAETESLTRQLAAAESQVEVQIHQQLVSAVRTLRDHLDAARAAGLDPGEYAAYADATEKANQQLSIPRTALKTIDEVQAKTASLQQATDAKIAADESARQVAAALQASKDGAQAALQTAQGALARAKTITVLKVADNEKAINDLAQQLAQKLAASAPRDDFLALAQGLRGQAASLNNLVDTRQATYDLLTLTGRELDAAANAKNDVSAERAQLAPLGPQLDQAGDLGTITAIKGQVQAIKNAVDAKYLAALYGVGKVIVTSVTQERLVALQDGVVVLDTLVTTGRPSLPTVLGTFHIYYKSSPYHMHSPWPPGNQYWYPDVDMNWAMEFESSGYFIHDAPWRSHYGPGSDTEHGGTHGCINVQNNQMQFLYGWADIGTTVINKAGDLPVT